MLLCCHARTARHHYALAHAIALLENRKWCTCYIIANGLKQTKEAMSSLKFSYERYNDPVIRIRDSNNERSITHKFSNGNMEVHALAAKEDN